MNILVLVGSSRRGSFNGQLADAAVALLPADATVTTFDLTTLPFYDADRDAAGELGPVVQQLRAAVTDADALLVASPAYNGGMAAEVKNAIDTASRPPGAAAIAGKPVGVLTSPFNPKAGASVADQLTMALTIAGAKPVGAVIAPLAQSFENDDVTPAVRDDLKKMVHGLVEAVEQDESAAA